MADELDDNKEKPTVNNRYRHLLKGNPNWKKGVSGNPKGRPEYPPGIRAEAKMLSPLNPLTVGKYLQEALMHDEATAKKIIEDESQTIIRRWMHKISLRGFKDNDVARLNFLLERSIGKIKQEIDYKGNVPMIQQNILNTDMSISDIVQSISNDPLISDLEKKAIAKLSTGEEQNVIEVKSNSAVQHNGQESSPDK
jgi:hypothetical protein